MKNRNTLHLLLILALFVLTGYSIVSTQRLKARLDKTDAAPQEPATTQLPTMARSERPPASRLGSGEIADLSQRLSEMEQVMQNFSRANDYLMERGQLPLATNKVGDLHARLADTTLPEDQRLRALRLLRRNQALDDQALQTTVAWMQTTTAPNIKRDILQQIEGLTNGFLKDPVLQIALTETNSDLREEAMETLRAFVNDPQTEQALWQRLSTEPDREVREQIEETLAKARPTPERIASLQQRALNPAAPLDERVTAIRGLREARADISTVVPVLIEQAQNTADPGARARLFGAFDGVTDPSVKVPLVNGLQDPHPGVRQQAADALSGFVSDPAVQQWLQHIAATDTDPRVRREAFEALGRNR